MALTALPGLGLSQNTNSIINPNYSWTNTLNQGLPNVGQTSNAGMSASTNKVLQQYGLGTTQFDLAKTSAMGGTGPNALASPSFKGGMQNFVETVDTQRANSLTDTSGLGDNGMDMKTKIAAGLGAVETGLNVYTGINGQNLQDKQIRENKRQFNENMAMQKGTMAGNLTTEYNTAAHPEMLAASKEAYLKQYNLG